MEKERIKYRLQLILHVLMNMRLVSGPCTIFTMCEFTRRRKGPSNGSITQTLPTCRHPRPTAAEQFVSLVNYLFHLRPRPGRRRETEAGVPEYAYVLKLPGCCQQWPFQDVVKVHYNEENYAEDCVMHGAEGSGQQLHLSLKVRTFSEEENADS